MEFSGSRIPDPMVYCPIFGKDISYGLCWEISNIGDDSLDLPADKRPPCGWEAAYEVCKKCPVYLSL